METEGGGCVCAIVFLPLPLPVNTLFPPVPDSSVVVATPFDPLLLLLPVLEGSSKLYSPLSTLLSGSECPALQAVAKECLQPPDKLAVICDTSDRMGPDMLMYRLNEDKTLAWLIRKVCQYLLDTTLRDVFNRAFTCADESNSCCVEAHRR